MSKRKKMNTQKEKPEQKTYQSGIKESGRLEKQQQSKSSVLHKAYEAAVAELGYSDKELIDPSKGKKVAKLMFSGKYLGNASFNPLLKDGMYKSFGEKSEGDKQRLYQHMLGMDLNTFVRDDGIASKHGMKRGAITGVIENYLSSQTAHQLTTDLWMKTYDPDKSLSDNIANYVNVLQEDPILAYKDTKVNAGKFESIDDVAQAVTTSLLGQSNRDTYQHRYGAKFN
jgi:hypothetical protein